MGKRFVALLAGVAALALLLVGCGGGGGGDESLTKADFVKQANEICAAGLKDLGAELEAFAAEQKGNERPGKAKGAELMEDTVVPAFRSEVDELQELPLPVADEDRLERMLDKMDAGVEEAEADPAGLIEASGNQMGKGREIAEDYGLESCLTLY